MRTRRTQLTAVDEDTGRHGVIGAALNGDTVLEGDIGIDTLPLACQERPDLFLLDMATPGLDGVAVARVLQGAFPTC